MQKIIAGFCPLGCKDLKALWLLFHFVLGLSAGVCIPGKQGPHVPWASPRHFHDHTPRTGTHNGYPSLLITLQPGTLRNVTKQAGPSSRLNFWCQPPEHCGFSPYCESSAFFTFAPSQCLLVGKTEMHPKHFFFPQPHLPQHSSDLVPLIHPRSFSHVAFLEKEIPLRLNSSCCSSINTFVFPFSDHGMLELCGWSEFLLVRQSS